MIKKVAFFIIVVFVLSSGFVFSAPIEDIHDQMTKTEVFSKVDEEHRNTRKYFTDELSRQVNSFYTEIDDRGLYYENEFKKMLLETYFKLGMIFAGVVVVSVAISHIFKLKTERVRFNNLKKSLVDELKLELFGKQEIKQELKKDSFEIETDEKIRLNNEAFKKDIGNKSLDVLQARRLLEEDYKELSKNTKLKEKLSFLKKKQDEKDKGVSVFSENLRI